MADVNFKNSADISWLNSSDVNWVSQAETIYSLVLGSGVYSLIGSIVNLQELQVSLEAGAYSLIGATITLTHDYTLNLESGTYSITGTFIDFTYLKEIATGWISTKGEGPWEFDKEINKPRYNEGTHIATVENPLWIDITNDHTPITTTHTPCGYWPVLPYSNPVQPCLVFDSEVYLPTVPNTIGLYASGDAMVYEDGHLYGGGVDSGTIFKVRTDTLEIVSLTVFADADVSSIRQVIVYDGYIYALIERSGYTGNWIQKISIPALSENFTLIGEPLYCGSVCYGTDGKVYGAKEVLNLNSGYIGGWTPITGEIWEYGWEELPETYSYYIHMDIAAVAAASGYDVCCGSVCINFKIIDANNIVINSGPNSGFLAYTAAPSLITWTGQLLGVYLPNTIIGPNEIVANNEGTELALLRCTSAFTDLTFRYIDVSSSVSTDTLITGLLDYNGALYDGSIYHHRTIWCDINNRVYSLHATWPDLEGRIIAVDSSGNLLHQYSLPRDPVSLNYGSFTIMNDSLYSGYVYLWQDSLHSSDGSTAKSSIIKLTLDLEFVCIQDCEGVVYDGTSTEVGRSVVNDGEGYLYNFSNPAIPDGENAGKGAITKWYAPEGGGLT